MYFSRHSDIMAVLLMQSPVNCTCTVHQRFLHINIVWWSISVVIFQFVLSSWTLRIFVHVRVCTLHFTPRIRFMCSQKWNCAASFPIPTFLYLWAIYIFLGPVCLFGWSKKTDRSWEYITRSQIHECGNREREHYNSILDITRPRSFISENT
jgi:hypothetical protein